MTTGTSTLLRALAFGILCMGVVLWPQSAPGHGEALEIGEAPARGPVTLSAAQTEALGLELAAAELRPVAKRLRLYGTLTVLPDRQAAVTVRVSGRVAAVYANVGDEVRKGERLALLEARTLGDPPPRVSVRSPIDGVVDRRNLVVGQPIEPSSWLFHVSRLDRIRVLARVFEEDLERLRVGQDAEVGFLAFPDQLFRGQVDLIGPTLDPNTRTAEVWIDLDNAEGLLKPNLFAKADVIIGFNPAALTIPNVSIIQAQEETFVFVRQGDRYERMEVAPGTRDGEFSEVTSGLVPGDEVVTQGARELYTLWLTGAASGD